MRFCNVSGAIRGTGRIVFNLCDGFCGRLVNGLHGPVAFDPWMRHEADRARGRDRASQPRDPYIRTLEIWGKRAICQVTAL